MGIDKTASERFLVVGMESKETSERHLIDLNGVQGGEM
jgi:protease II